VTPGKTGVPAQRLMELASKYERIDAKERNPVESHVVVSAERLDTYFRVHRQLQLLGQPFEIDGELRTRLGGIEKAYLATLVEKGPEFIGLVRVVPEQDERSGDRRRNEKSRPCSRSS
jgi:hypothetical protein